jgi:hypothetical protein
MFAEVYDSVLTKYGCAESYCHGWAGPDYRARRDAMYADLIDKPASRSCTGGFLRVVPGSPEESLLYLKVSMDVPPCGTRMPFGATHPLPAADIDLIRTWIQGGALP